MASKKDFNVLLLRISSLINNSSEYFSHQTALFLLGFVKTPPSTITIISTKRRRNRQINEFKVVFVSRKNTDIKNIQSVVYEGFKFVVSTLERTIADLVENLNYSPKSHLLAQLFAQLPLKKNILINIAANTSDTVLKRVTFYLAWSGRVKFAEIPFKRFKRTPILIDSREKKGLVWLKYFYCKYPKSLLNIPVSKNYYKKLQENEMLWMELRAHKTFCNYQFANNILIIRENPDQENTLDDFFTKWLKELTDMQLDQILTVHNSAKNASKTSLPKIFNTWFRNDNKRLLIRLSDIKTWVKKNIISEDINRIEAAMHFGLFVGLDDLVLKEFDKVGFSLFSSAKFKLIFEIADRFLKANKILPLSVYLTISKTYTFADRFNDALRILEEARDKFTGDEHFNQLGSIHHSMGALLLRLNRVSEAIKEIFLARKYFSKTNDLELIARVECTLGNLYLKQGKTQNALNSFKSSFSMAKSANIKSLQASLLGNIGIVEYDLGNFIKARYLLFQSFSLHNVMKNFWNASIAQLAIGKIDMKLGYFSKSIKIFRECHSTRVREKNVSGAHETSCLLAWVYEILGKTAAARTWWNQAARANKNQLDSRSYFVSASLKAMTCLFKTNFNEALVHYNNLLTESIMKNASKQQIGNAQHGIASSKAFLALDKEAIAFIKQARLNIGSKSNRIQIKQINILASLFYPEEFQDIVLKTELDEFVKSGCYDPFWWLFAIKLSMIGSQSSRTYLKHHISKTPNTTLKICMAKIPELNKIIQDLSCSKSRANQFVTFMTETETKPVHFDDYIKWKQRQHKAQLIFDGPSGVVKFENKERNIKFGSIPHSLLSQLFLGYPHSLEISALYETAWEMKYDHEIDYGAFKSSLQRLKNYLGELCCPVEIIRKKTKAGKSGIKISLPNGWTFIYI